MQYTLQCPPYLGWYLPQVEVPVFFHTMDMQPGDPMSHWSVSTRHILLMENKHINCSSRSLGNLLNLMTCTENKIPCLLIAWDCAFGGQPTGLLK